MTISTPPGSPNLGRATYFATRAALCVLVPVPLMDDLLLAQTRKRMVREMASRRGVDLTPEAARLLAEGERKSYWGCPLGLVTAIFVRLPLKLLRRVVRTLLFFLAVRDASAAATLMFHESYLVELGMAGLKSGAPVTAVRIQPLRAAIAATMQDVDPRPVRGAVTTVFRGSLSLLRQSARALARSVRRRSGGEKEEETAGDRETKSLREHLAEALSGEAEYLDELRQAFGRHWPAAGSDSQPRS